MLSTQARSKSKMGDMVLEALDGVGWRISIFVRWWGLSVREN